MAIIRRNPSMVPPYPATPLRDALEQTNALEILNATGFIGGAEADTNLSTDYKAIA